MGRSVGSILFGALQGGCQVPIGALAIERDGAFVPYNAALHLRGGRVLHRHRKVYLPTYGMFDEARHFAAGDTVEAYDWDGWRVGMLVCEDFWHPGLVYALCAQRIELLVVISGAPGRGVWEADAGARFASWQVWRDMARVYARVFGIYVALANRAGVEEGVTFAGGSLIAAPDGQLVAEAPEGEVATVAATLERAELTRLRTPAWHGRDDRPLVVARALLRAERVPRGVAEGGYLPQATLRGGKNCTADVRERRGARSRRVRATPVVRSPSTPCTMGTAPSRMASSWVSP